MKEEGAEFKSSKEDEKSRIHCITIKQGGAKKVVGLVLAKGGKGPTSRADLTGPKRGKVSKTV